MKTLSSQLASAQATLQEKDDEIKRILAIGQDKDKELDVNKVRIDFLEETIKKWESIRTIDGLTDTNTTTKNFESNSSNNNNNNSSSSSSNSSSSANTDEEEVSALRKQITIMKTLQNSDENDSNTNHMPHDIYSAHLIKLLKLAEDAINKT